jgi:hypothetical protein
VDRDDQSAKFWLNPVVLSRNLGFSPAELRKIHAIVPVACFHHYLFQFRLAYGVCAEISDHPVVTSTRGNHMEKWYARFGR